MRGVGLVLAVLFVAAAHAAPESKAPNFGSIANTRHNMTQSYLGANAGWMSLSRNDYGEVCVYCHTPHGASGTLGAPLWNRTIKSTGYTTYGSRGTTSMTQPVSAPGTSSLTCLSCHDGTTAIDSIINMPGPRRYDAGQETDDQDDFLNQWPGGPGDSFWGGHGTLEVSQSAFNQYGACQSCHSVSGDQYDPSTIPAFDVFYIGTDLTDDHPVGVTFPEGDPDYNTPSATVGKLRFYDDGDGYADSDEIRLYDSGEGFEVECASCHDPHGVPSAGAGSQFNASFLRVSNEESTVCRTCHNK